MDDKTDGFSGWRMIVDSKAILAGHEWWAVGTLKSMNGVQYRVQSAGDLLSPTVLGVHIGVHSGV